MNSPRYARGLPRVVRRTLANLLACWLVGNLETWRLGGARVVRASAAGSGGFSRVRRGAPPLLGGGRLNSLPRGKTASAEGVMNWNDTRGGAGLLGGRGWWFLGLPAGKGKRFCRGGRYRAGRLGRVRRGACQLANLPTCRLSDLLGSRKVGDLERWRPGVEKRGMGRLGRVRWGVLPRC